MSTPRTLVSAREHTHAERANPPVAAVVDASPTTWTLVDLERYEVRHGGAVVGYVDVVGPVFVALVGMRYDRATEVAQTLTFMTAIQVVAAVASE